MSLKRECDRCHHLTPVDSLNGREFRQVQVSRGATPSSSGGVTTLYTPHDLCSKCTLALEKWLETEPPKAATS